jgi:hypothetical protein
MVYHTQNYWIFGLFHCPVFYELENTTFRQLDLFPFSGANLNHWSSDPHMRTETDPVFEFLAHRIPNDGKSKKPNNSGLFIWFST